MKKINKDIIEFRYKLIDQFCAKYYNFDGVACNDGRTEMTEEKRKVIEDVLKEFNTFFGCKNYDLG